MTLTLTLILTLILILILTTNLSLSLSLRLIRLRAVERAREKAWCKIDEYGGSVLQLLAIPQSPCSY